MAASASPSHSFMQSTPSDSGSGFPVLAVAVLGISATAFLLVSYYIFITKCCFRWQQIDPLSRFSTRPLPQVNDDPLVSYSPSSWQTRGLNELLIREIPTFQYTKRGNASSKCVVCLNEFQENDTLRVLPKCSHAFHLDCIDVWLLANSNCPLCRSAISGRNRYRVERIVAPNSSPQDLGSVSRGQDDFVVIEISGGEDGIREREGGVSSRRLGKFNLRKFHHVSVMGDEGIDVREKDEQFSIQPIRRSFSMDSAAERGVYLSIQEIVRQNRLSREIRRNEETSSSSSSRSRRSFFSFGHGRGSRNAVLPL